MSGRAGRRGLDARGIVIMMCDEKIDSDAAKGMVKGQADRLDSAFHLGYNMIINLMRVEGISPEYMLERCFFQFQNTMSVPVLEERESISRTTRSRLINQNCERPRRSETVSSWRRRRRSQSTMTCGNCSRRRARISKLLLHTRRMRCHS